LLIRAEGRRPEAFASAQEFLDRPRALVPNCLILDISLPRLNGLDLQKRIAGLGSLTQLKRPNDDGLMALRFASINGLPVLESDRKYHWPLGRRPDDHPGLSDLAL
jgi:hypothetical protein